MRWEGKLTNKAATDCFAFLPVTKADTCYPLLICMCTPLPGEWPRPTLTLLFKYHLTLLRVSDLAYPITLLRDGRDLEFIRATPFLCWVPDKHP